MHRWIANAAGGTSHRLKPAPAMIRSRSSMPTDVPTRAPLALMKVSSARSSLCPESFGVGSNSQVQ